jgi:predicted ATPase
LAAGSRAVLALPAADAAELLPRIVSVLQGRRMLIVLDNCDRIAAEVGTIVIELLRGADTVKVLATSQAPLNFIGERVMRLPPLALPDGASTVQQPLEEIAATPAVDMLLTRIRCHQPAFQLTEANAASVVEICRQLDGMPLALELAAARFALLAPDQVLRRLEQRFRFLKGTAAGRDPSPSKPSRPARLELQPALSTRAAATALVQRLCTGMDRRVGRRHGGLAGP